MTDFGIDNFEPLGSIATKLASSQVRREQLV
jgi:hypothetical protein